jgi:phage terminase large subunit
LPSSQTEQALESLQRWRRDPVLFVRQALGAEPLEWQAEALTKLRARRRLSVRSGHGVGKTTVEAWAIIWFLLTHFPCKIPATAPTSHQLSDILWSELAKWHRTLSERFPALGLQLEWTSEKFALQAAPNEAFAVARTSRPERPEALQGFHAPHLLFVIDEASGVPDTVFEVAEGALSTEGAYVLMCANPTRQSGYFFDSHHRMRDSWATMHVNSELVPIVSAQYVETMAKKYGRDSAIYQVRVLGEFATAIDGVIPLELCTAAQERMVEPVSSSGVVWGLDVARFGDDSTALAKRRGNVQVEPCREWYGKDTMQTVGLIQQEWDQTAPDDRPKSINVDVIGIGAGVCDRLREVGLPSYGINVAESASVQDKYNRLRDELWFKGREWLEARDCRLCDDESLVGELTTPRYTLLSSGKIKVEGKDELKARGVASPNLADAWLLTFASGHSEKAFRPLPVNKRWIV